jgi:hypothetical protein
MTPRAARPIPTAQPVNVTVAVNTGSPTAAAPVAQAARPAGNGLAVAAVQAIGAIGQAIASRRPRPVPVAQPVGGMVTGGVVGVPVVGVAAPVMPVAVAMPVAVTPLMPAGYAPQQLPQPFPTPSFPPPQQTLTAPRMPYAPANAGHGHGSGGGGEWEPANEHHDLPAADGPHDPVHESEPADPADCGGTRGDVQPDISDGCGPSVEDIQPDECEPTTEDVQAEAEDCEPTMDECEPAVEDVQPEWDECELAVEDVQPEWDECELPADDGEPTFDDCGGAVEEEVAPGFDECGGAMEDTTAESGCDEFGGGCDMADGMDAGFDTSGGADWAGLGGEYC